MTNEEAIKILFNIRAYYASLTAGYPPHDCYGLGDMKCSDMCDALLKGIRLLKQKPCEDAISRDELLKAINTWDKFGCDANTKLVPYQDHYIPYIHYDDVVKCIKDLPPITPQPKTGHWIYDGRNKICSECNFKIDTWHDTDISGKRLNYCPNCGRKIEERRNDNKL